MNNTYVYNLTKSITKRRINLSASFSIYPALMGSKTPASKQNSAKEKNLGGGGLPIKFRLVQLIISGDEETPTD